MKKLTSDELKKLADSYAGYDKNLASVLITLASCRLFSETTDLEHPEEYFLLSCIDVSLKINEAIDILMSDEHKSDLN